MALYIPHSISHLARLLDPTTYVPAQAGQAHQKRSSTLQRVSRRKWSIPRTDSFTPCTLPRGQVSPTSSPGELVPIGNRTPDTPAYTLVAILTSLSPKTIISHYSDYGLENKKSGGDISVSTSHRRRTDRARMRASECHSEMTGTRYQPY